MSTTSDSDWPQPDKNSSNDELQVDIDHTREQLGQTIDALSQKLDLKAQARHKLQDLNTRAATQLKMMRGRVDRAQLQAKNAATDERGNLKPIVPVGAAIVIATTAAIVALVMRSRRR